MSSRRVQEGRGRRPQSAKHQRFMALRERGWSILAASREVGVSRTAGNNWARGYKTYRQGQATGFVPALAPRQRSWSSTRGCATTSRSGCRADQPAGRHDDRRIEAAEVHGAQQAAPQGPAAVAVIEPGAALNQIADLIFMLSPGPTTRKVSGIAQIARHPTTFTLRHILILPSSSSNNSKLVIFRTRLASGSDKHP